MMKKMDPKVFFKYLDTLYLRTLHIEILVNYWKLGPEL